MVRQRAWKDECFYSGNREEISPTLVSLRKDRETCPGTDAHWDSIRLRSELCTPRAFIPRQAEAIIQANASQQHHFWPVTSMRNNYILGSKINEWLSQMVVPCCIRYPSPSFLTVPRLLLSLFLVLSFFLSFNLPFPHSYNLIWTRLNPCILVPPLLEVWALAIQLPDKESDSYASCPVAIEWERLTLFRWSLAIGPDTKT